MERSQEDTPFLCIVKNGESQFLTPKLFEKKFQIRFVPYLDIQDFAVFQTILMQTAQLQAKKKLSQKQLWLGCYFAQELKKAPMPPIELRWISDLLGWGVFATKNIPNLHFIAEYEGILRKRSRGDDKNAYCFEYLIHPEDPGPYIIDAQDQGGISRFINHSDNANLATSLATFDNLTRIVLFSKRPIKAGEQLLYDYGANYWKYRKKQSL